MGGFDNYTAASSTTPAAEVASTPSTDEGEDLIEAEEMIEPVEDAAPEAAWEAPVEDLPVAEEESVWTPPAAAEAEVSWDQAPAAVESAPEFPEAAPVAEYGEPETVELEAVAPAEVGFGGDDALADADVLADQVAEGGWDAAPAADAVEAIEEIEAIEPTPAGPDTADFGGVFGDEPAASAPMPSDADVFAEFAAHEASAPATDGEAVADDTFGTADEELPAAAEITPEPAAPTAAWDVEAEPAASVEPDWNAPAWQSDESAVEEEEIEPASAAPVWAEEPVAAPAAAAAAAPASPEIDLASASERIVAEAREQITARLSASLGSELGPLVEARVEAALDELLPRLIEKKLKSAVDQALQQAFDDLKRRLG